MPRAIHTIVADAERLYGPVGVAQLAAKISAKAHRMRLVRECPTPLDLAARFDLGLVRTPALELLNQRIQETMRTRDGRLVISLPPQEGKSNIIHWAIAHRLLHNPDGRIGYASYGKELARRGGRIVRGRIENFLSPGLRVAWDHRDAADWEIDGHRGGMYSVGVEGGFTGRPIDEGLVVDDPLKDLQDAESPAVLGYLMDWWETVAQTRIHPGAWVIVVATRWSEHDLSGRLIGEGWPSINIPAQAEHGVDDALGRPVGEFLTSVLGRTPDDWRAKRKGVGERTWFALYQGVPAPPKGDIFQEDWFDRDRVPERPAGSPPVVVIDPADNTGSGDEAGIIVASTDASQRIYLGPDYSDHYTIGRWVRVALLAVARHEASGLVFEQSLSGLPRSIQTGWDQLRKQALVLRRLGAVGPLDHDVVETAVTELAHPNDPDATWEQYRAELIELWPLVDRVLRFTPAGPMIRRIKPQGSKEWRAKAASPSYEQRRVSHVGKLPQLEHQMCFPGGTLVRTWLGDVPIETVGVGDLLLTRFGWYPVTWSGLTGLASCLVITIEDGTVLRVTPDHPIWVENTGWVSARSLVPGHIILKCQCHEPDRTSLSTDVHTVSTTTATTRRDVLGESKHGCCTETCGKNTTIGPSQMDGMSTTSITTVATTTPPISRQCLGMTITHTTLQTGDGTRGRASDALSSSRRTGPSSNLRGESVSTAEDHICQQGNGRSTANLDATKSTIENDLGCRNGLGTTLIRSALVRDVSSVMGPPRPVFNLSVDVVPEFFANGILVHNCTWKPGMKSPDRLDAAVHAVLLLSGASVAVLSSASGKGELPTRSTRNPSHRGGALPRSTMTRR